MIVLSCIIALPLLLLYNQETWIWYIGCQHPKVIKCCSPQSLSGSSSPTMSSYLETFSFIAPFISCPQANPCSASASFPLALTPTFKAIVISGSDMWVTRLLLFWAPVFLAETLHKQQYFACNFPSPHSAFIRQERQGNNSFCSLYLDPELSVWCREPSYMCYLNPPSLHHLQNCSCLCLASYVQILLR